MSQNAAKTESSQGVPLGALFVAFLKVALYGVGGGGGLVWSRRIAVEQRAWISDQEFADIVSLCQFMPGPNIVGIAVCVGTRLRGLAGAGAAVAGFLLLPWTLGLALGLLCLRYAHHPVLQHALSGVSAAAAGLLIATGIKMLVPHRRHPAALAFAALSLGLMGIGRLPLLLVLLGLAPISIGVARLRSVRER